MIPRFLFILFLIGQGFVLTAIPAQAQRAQPPQPSSEAPNAGAGAPGVPARPVNQFGDWSRQCEAIPGGRRPQCYLFQSVHLRENKKQILHLAIGFFGVEQKRGAIFQVPLGLHLPSGIVLEVAGLNPIRIFLDVCWRSGCRATVQLPDEIIEGLKSAETATVKLRNTRKRLINLPISLRGFAEVYNALNYR